MLNELNDQVNIEHCRFMRICAKVNLRKHLILKLIIRRWVHVVQYESLHLICFQCGKFGHRKDVFLEMQHANLELMEGVNKKSNKEQNMK